ncbi:MAG: hypothetical protein V4534_02815 [Myxococcota bacterium]
MPTEIKPSIGKSPAIDEQSNPVRVDIHAAGVTCERLLGPGEHSQIANDFVARYKAADEPISALLQHPWLVSAANLGEQT